MRDYYIIADISDGPNGVSIDDTEWYDSPDMVVYALDQMQKDVESRTYYDIIEKTKYSLKYEIKVDYDDDQTPILFHYVGLKISQMEEE